MALRLRRSLTDPLGIELEPGEYVRAARTERTTHHAVVRCPRCEKRMILTTKTHAVGMDGAVTPSLVCPHDPCGFHDYIHLDFWSE